MPELISAILPGVGALIVAALSGAGGAVLLELWWKPRRDRRRAATLIHADLITNVQLIRAWAGLRKMTPLKIPQDLKLTRIGFEVAGQLASELPTPLVRSVVVIYHEIDTLNWMVDAYATAVDELDRTGEDSERKGTLESLTSSILVAFNTGLDRLDRRCQSLGSALEKLAGIKVPKNIQPRDFTTEAEAFARDRAEQVASLTALQRQLQKRKKPTKE